MSRIALPENCASVIARIRDMYDSGEIIRAHFAGEYPLEVKIRGLTPALIRNNFPELLPWIQEMQQHRELTFKVKEFKSKAFGSQFVPAAVVLPDLPAAAKLCGRLESLLTFRKNFQYCQKLLPQVCELFKAKPKLFLDNAAIVKQLVEVCLYLQKHPRPEVYVREVVCPGVDTKFIEHNFNMLSVMLDCVLPPEAVDLNFSGKKGFNRRYGFRDKPNLIRLRLLDPSVRIGSLPCVQPDFSLDERSLAQYELPVSSLLIVENEITYLSLPQLSDCAAVFGGGFGISPFVAQMPWISHKKIVYWGDLDKSGFKILNQVRCNLAHCQVDSILMDESTIAAWKHLGVRDTDTTVHKLQALTAAEQQAYQALVQDKYAPSLRIEQELIPMDAVQAALAQAGFCSPKG